ncbi:MAG: hypothetical protein AABW68_01805 [archaeon]
MKHENGMKLHVPAFGIAGGILGLAMGFLMGSGASMMGPGFTGYGMMGGFGGGGFIGVGMGVFIGILTGIFAALYNWLSERMG